MTGSITNTTIEDRVHVVGEFDVSNNSYEITQLSFNFHEDKNRARSGTMTINGKVVDIEGFDH